MQVVLTGWPERKHLVPQEVKAYFSSHDELSVQDGLLFKGNRVVIPTSLRQSIIQKIHSTHMGIEGSLYRAREAYYWPLMNAEVKDFISKCSVCNTIKPDQCREELMPHELPERPWSKVGTDLFTFGEMDRLHNTTSKATIDTLKKQFARHGIPDVLISDNGPQYSSDEFRQFASHWEFKHITSSPKHP